MNRKQTKPLSLRITGRWAGTVLTALLAVSVSVGAQAQTRDAAGSQPPRDLNSELRSGTWSVYVQGGLSWADGVWYPNLDAKRSYNQSPAVGGGIDYTIRPWVRVGAEYLWSNYRREQRFSALDTRTMPVQAYGNYKANYHNAKLGLQFNLMELWSGRRAQWLNIWAGTGAGMTWARGNEYGIWFSNTITQDGKTSPLTPDVTISNDSQVTVTGNVRTANEHSSYRNLYIPASLHIEADLSRQLTIGLKGEMDWLMKRSEISPKSYAFALVTLRYNFVPSRAKVQRRHYEGEISRLNDRANALQREAEKAVKEAEKAAADNARLQQQNADLEQRLSECASRKPEPAAGSQPQPQHFVQFDNNSSFIGSDETESLKAFAARMKGSKLSLVAEASTPGAKEYNQQLSERRLQRVIDILVKEGFDPSDLKPSIAIGAQNGKPAEEGRRVTITVEQSK